MSKKNKLLDNLQYNTYCRLGRSNIHGIGVIAIKDIPKGINPFHITGNKSIDYKSVDLTQQDIDQLNPEVKKLITDFIHPDKNNIYSVPYYGMNSLDITFYMNHSDNNNISIKSDPNDDYMIFYTNRLIKQGEELLINYNDY